MYRGTFIGGIAIVTKLAFTNIPGSVGDVNALLVSVTTKVDFVANTVVDTLVDVCTENEPLVTATRHVELVQTKGGQIVVLFWLSITRVLGRAPIQSAKTLEGI